MEHCSRPNSGWSPRLVTQCVEWAWCIVSVFVRSIVGLVAGVVLSASAAAHSVYTSATDIFWNTEDKTLELVLEAHSHALEARLSLDIGERLTFLEEADLPALEAALAPYMKESVAVALDGKAVALSYLGVQLRGQTLQIYMESQPVGPWAEIGIRQDFLLRAYSAQQNTILFRSGSDLQTAQSSRVGQVIRFLKPADAPARADGPAKP